MYFCVYSLSNMQKIPNNESKYKFIADNSSYMVICHQRQKSGWYNRCTYSVNNVRALQYFKGLPRPSLRAR
jgi:hypothetical protein